MTINLKAKKSATCAVDIQNVGEHVESIILVKPVTLQPHSRFVINTGINVTVDGDADELWVNAGINSDKTNDTEDDIPHYMISERYTKAGCETAREIVLVGFYDGDEEITLNKGVCVARLHYSFMEANDRIMDAAHEVRNNAIYNNEDLLVCVNKEENLDKFIVETIVDGEKTYLKISQKEGQNE